MARTHLELSGSGAVDDQTSKTAKDSAINRKLNRRPLNSGWLLDLAKLVIVQVDHAS